MSPKSRSFTLYKCAVTATAMNYNRFRSDLVFLPKNVLFDVYCQLYETGKLCQLGIELTNLEAFSKMLHVKCQKYLLHRCFQALMDNGIRISEILAQAYEYQAMLMSANKCSLYERNSFIQLGIQLGVFLNECGWLKHSQSVLTACLSICFGSGDDAKSLLVTLNCCQNLLFANRRYCNFSCAQKSYEWCLEITDQLTALGVPFNKAALYTEFSGYFCDKSEYSKSFEWAQKALSSLNSSLPPKIIIDVLRQAAVASVVQRKFNKAKVLIKQAYCWGKRYLDENSPKFADLLTDYGFYYLSVDHIVESVELYRAALNSRRHVFDGVNLYVALAHENLAYASYIHDYSIGTFNLSREHAEQALQMMASLVPSDHLLLASSKRVKALILEEIAIDDPVKDYQDGVLAEAQELQLSALASAQQEFGENNVQTAKYYGNIGRLYQSMSKYEEAEKMFLKAIAIKEQLLGPDDTEVALSVGHLASLYCYELEEFRKAEKLYLRSINIGIKLFGVDYSGLQYDYTGLQRTYRFLNEPDKANYYLTLLSEWRQLRNQRANHKETVHAVEPMRTIEEIVELFNGM